MQECVSFDISVSSHFREIKKRLTMTKHINIDKSKSPCDSTNHQMPDSCVLEMLTEDLGCNLPWKSTVNGNFVFYILCNVKNYNSEIILMIFKQKF